MVVPPLDSPTGQHSAAQESMFEDPAGFVGLEAYEVSEEPFYEAEEQFSTDAVRSISDEHLPEPVAEHSAVAMETMHEGEPDHEPAHEPDQLGSHPDSASSAHAESAAEPRTVLTVDDFAALEDRVLRAVNLVRREREARIAAEERASALNAQLQAQSPAIERLQQEVDLLRIERDQVRQRVERLLSQLDALEL